jgi:hypothetical protein
MSRFRPAGSRNGRTAWRRASRPVRLSLRTHMRHPTSTASSRAPVPPTSPFGSQSLIINLNTAKALVLTIPPNVLDICDIADEVIV